MRVVSSCEVQLSSVMIAGFNNPHWQVDVRQETGT
jgi:hypothetical protein